MSEVDDQYVKRGFWINWSQGFVLGGTLTVDSRSGNAVVALLTICASIGTAQLFHLFAFFYHQWRAKGRASDGLYWQQQALLRTFPTPTTLVAEYFKLWWSWRNKVNHAFVRSWITLLFALCFSVASITVGICTSYVISTSNLEVLVHSPLCSKINVTTLWTAQQHSVTIGPAYYPVIQSYTQTCYQNNTAPPAICRNIFARPKVSYTVESASCPWEPSMCMNKTGTTIIVDSGLLDMSEQFGWNLKERDRVRYRKKTTCSILPLAGHEEIRNATDFTGKLPIDPSPGEQVLGYRYSSETEDMYMFMVSLPSANSSRKFSSNGQKTYLNPIAGLPHWKPLPEMNRTDADLALAAIAFNNVKYDNPVDDPVFSAHKQQSYTYRGKAMKSYRPDAHVGIIGCMEQYQFCTSQPGGAEECTALSGLPFEADILSGKLLNATSLQLSLLALLRTASMLNDMTNAPAIGHIKANDFLNEGFTIGLPDDQWIKEVAGWADYVWAGLTIMLSDAVVGPKLRDPVAVNYTDAPTTEGDKLLCKSLKMRKAGGFANISVFGLTFIITVSSIIALINFFVIRFLIFLSRFRRALAPRLDHWINDGVYQLQRRAFESYGEGEWIRFEEEIPITAEKAKMAPLPMTMRSLTSVTLTESDFEKGYVLGEKGMEKGTPETPRTPRSRGE